MNEWGTLQSSSRAECPIVTFSLSADPPAGEERTLVRVRMISQLLDLTRARLGGGFPLELVQTDLRDVCRTVADELLGRVHVVIPTLCSNRRPPRR